MTSPTRTGRGLLRRLHPTQAVVAGFGTVIVTGSALLSLPIAQSDRVDHAIGDPVFTAVSATTVTGLQVVDPATAWSGFGEVVILVMIQIGGLGLMAVSSVLAVALAGRLGLRHRMAAQAEGGMSGLGDLRQVVAGAIRWTFAIEAVSATALFGGFLARGDESVGRSAWLAVFHAVSAFNNAGFGLYSDNLIGFVEDPWISGVVSLTIVLGGIGFPVLMQLWRFRFATRRWSVHVKMTVVTTAVLLVGGTLAILALEWSNPGTLGPLGLVDKVMAGWFQSVSPRTAGFNTVDYAAMGEAALLVTVVLMFIGAASGSTGGGIKVTTFAVLGHAIWAEVRGARDVEAYRRRIPETALRQALSVALLGVAAVIVGTMALMTLDELTLRDGLFEATSAFGTVGLSTGVTPELSGASQVVLGVMMFLGRVGPVTLVAALTLREVRQRYRYPEERPLIG